MINTKFFETLYQFCDTGFIEIRKLPARTQDYIPLTNIKSMDNICAELDQNHYFGVALRNGQGGTKENITQIPALWVDLDFKDTPIEIARQKISQFPFKPSLMVHSGHGIHCYWILNEPADQEDIEIIEETNRRIAIYLGGDTNACDAARILRIPGTMNVKREPYVECKTLRVDDYTYNFEDLLDILPEEEKPQTKETPQQGESWLLDAMLGVAEGNRETTAAKIAGYWINKVPPSDVLTILKTWNVNNTPPLDDACILSTVKSVSRYEPEKEKSILDNVYDSKRMVMEYEKYIKSLKNNKFLTGISEIDKRIRGIAGGEVLTIIARAGSFKTAMLQNLLKNYISHSAWGAVFFSIEMPVSSITERFFQIADGESGKEVENTFAKNTADKVASVSQFQEDYKKLYIVPSRIKLSDIPKYIEAIEKEYSAKIGVIGIDYIGLIDAKGSGEYEIMSRVAKGIKAIAKLINLPTIVLSQVNRAGQDGTVEITLAMGRGSGAIEEAADFVFGLWQVDKESYNDDGAPDKGLICKILKNRKGFPGSAWDVDIMPNTLQMSGAAIRYGLMKSIEKKGF